MPKSVEGLSDDITFYLFDLEPAGPSWPQDGGAAQPAHSQIIQRLVCLLNPIDLCTRAHLSALRYRKELLRVAAREIRATATERAGPASVPSASA